MTTKKKLEPEPVYWTSIESFMYLDEDGAERLMGYGQVVEDTHPAMRLHSHFFSEFIPVTDEIYSITES